MYPSDKPEAKRQRARDVRKRQRAAGMTEIVLVLPRVLRRRYRRAEIPPWPAQSQPGGGAIVVQRGGLPNSKQLENTKARSWRSRLLKNHAGGPA